MYCLAENDWAYSWREDDAPLTACPNDSQHEIQPGSASIADEVNTGVVRINKEEGFRTRGHARVDALELAVAPGATGEVVKVWPIDIAMYTIRLSIPTSCVGCRVTAEAAPGTTVGALTADAADGATVLAVSPSAAANTDPGYVITLRNGAAVQELGMATAVDRAANTITVASPVAGAAFTAAGPTLVCVTSRAADNVPLNAAGDLSFGEARAQAVPFLKGTPFRVSMTNPNLVEARLVVYITYNY
ncbi:MAG: hypothetical protein WC700_04295 [Gemmatimonadaceae bacterium]